MFTSCICKCSQVVYLHNKGGCVTSILCKTGLELCSRQFAFIFSLHNKDMSILQDVACHVIRLLIFVFKVQKDFLFTYQYTRTNALDINDLGSEEAFIFYSGGYLAASSDNPETT